MRVRSFRAIQAKPTSPGASPLSHQRWWHSPFRPPTTAIASSTLSDSAARSGAARTVRAEFASFTPPLQPRCKPPSGARPAARSFRQRGAQSVILRLARTLHRYTQTLMTSARLVEEFLASLPYQLDDFQLEAIQALAKGHSVLVAAPTGTGKTVVGEFGIFQARKHRLRALYTTPIKALSNQKFRDFRARWGDAEVGLVTGDVVVNRDSPVLVMTTEVLRNMLVTGANIDDVGTIVFDEVHYMGDAERGTAWEESILLAPRHIPLVCLSATVPNAAEIAEWIRDAHGDLTMILHDHRAVPLEHRYWLPGADRASADLKATPPTFAVTTIVDADGNPTNDARKLRGVGGELAGRVRWGGVTSQGFRGEDRLPGSDKDPRELPAPWRVVRYLDGEALTPAIYFLFSRRATEEAASSCVALRPVPHAAELVREAKSRLADLAPADRDLRQVALLLGRFLPRGVAVHHAGLLPQVKLLVGVFPGGQ